MVAFVAMPLLTEPLGGRFTGASLAGFPPRNGLGWLWLAPVVCLAVIALELPLVAGSSSTAKVRRSSLGSGALALAVVASHGAGLVYLYVKIGDTHLSVVGLSATGVLGRGFWTVLAGMAFRRHGCGCAV
jgi:hypothetical protein